MYVNLLGNRGPHHDPVPWRREISSQEVPRVAKAINSPIADTIMHAQCIYSHYLPALKIWHCMMQ